MAATPPGPAPPRILLAGDAHGRLHQLFKRVKSVATPSTYHSLFLLSLVPPVNQSTGPFHALLCVGQFFSPEGDAEGAPGDVADYIEGRASVPIPTYFTGDYGPSAPRLLSKAAAGARGFAPGGIEICPNLFWLRGSNRFTLHGLSVVYLSGRKGLGGPGCYSQDDVDALRALAEEPGIVLGPNGYDPIVAELVAEIKPRYHIAGTKGVFYSREPYVNDSAAHVTRFIGLANVGNKEKQKFIHAIYLLQHLSCPVLISMRSLQMLLCHHMLVHQNQFLLKKLQNVQLRTLIRNTGVMMSSGKGMVKADGGGLCFKFTSSGSCQRGSKCNYRHDEEAVEHYQRNVCFDFLNKGKCEKGPECNERRRVESSCWFCLSSPDVESHLVISIGEGYYCTLAKGPLVPNHVLMIPVEHCPSTLMMPPEAEAELGRYKIALDGAKTARESLMSQCESKSGLFYVELPEGRILLHMVDSNEKFPVQFGREVLAGLLSMADRADWRNCKISKEEEIEMVDDFKQGFREFDPAE
ncbi:unnamed protein product [Miscanthus lutarioriparius]|uniref:C3H1-type domain-containing protein n=1 Tax=Miscanthus lutarioriparius TaxID=422564 RepID=A0A811N7M1_9POAL|nr:unnamed protein product [Miscanthus lutarioriparius]